MNLHTDKFAIIFDHDSSAYMLYSNNTYLWRCSISDLLSDQSADKWTTPLSLIDTVHSCNDYEVLYSYPTRKDFVDAHPELLL